MANEVHIAVKVRDESIKGFKAIGSAIVGLTGTAVIPAAAAVAALGVELVGAGAALGVFGAAVAPQISALKEVNTAQDAYNKAVTDYGKNSTQAATALKKYHGELAALNPAQRAAFTSFSSLKTAFSNWSNSLSGDTLPVFTHAMNGLKNVFPLLTPLVKAVSKELLGLSLRFEAFSKTDKFKGLVSSFSSFAAGALKNVISGIEKLARLIAGWVTSAGFKDFLKTGQQEGPGLAKSLQNIAEAVGKFIAAAGPLAGLQLKIFESLASALNAIPMDVLKILVPTILGVALALKVLAAAETIYNAVLAITDIELLANPWTWIVLAIVAVIAAIVLIATKTKWFQEAWHATWNAIKTAFSATVNFLRSGMGKIVLLLGPLGAVIWIAANWGKVKDAVGKAISGIIGWVKQAVDWIKKIPSRTVNIAQKGASAVVGAAKDVWGWMKKLPSRTLKIAEQGSKMVLDKVKNLVNWIGFKLTGKKLNFFQIGLDSILRAVKTDIDWIRRLVGKTVHIGVSGITGAISAVKSLIGWIRNIVGKTVTVGVNVVGAAKKLLGFAHGGIVGAAAGGGPRSNSVLVGEQGTEIVDLPTGSRVRSNADTRRILGSAGGGSQPMVIVLQFGDRKIADLLIDPMRKSIQVRGGVQAALGKL